MRSRTRAEHPAGTNKISPSTNAGCPTSGRCCRKWGFSRHTSSHKIPNVSAASMDDLRLRPIHSQHRERRLPAPHQPTRIDRTERFLQIHARGQPRDRKFREMPFDRPPQLVLIAARAAFLADGERRSRSRQISSFVGRACPSRCTASRSVPFFTSASSTRRTVFRSADHRCSRHLLCSPEIEYFDCARSNATAPSSSTTAPAASLRKSCDRPAERLWGHAPIVHIGADRCL